MPTHIHVKLPGGRDHKRSSTHHDDKQQIPGWAPERVAKHEPPAVNKNIGDIGRWLERASANSGPKIPKVAPGVGVKK